MMHSYLVERDSAVEYIFSNHVSVRTCSSLTIFSFILDPIVKEQGRLTMVSSSPTPMAGSVPVGE